jgi:hypothetical protein
MSFIGDIFRSPKPPPAPNPRAMIQEQHAANEQVARLQARLNRPVMVTTPYGTTAWEDVGDDRWRSTQELSPGGAARLAREEALGVGLGDLVTARLGQIPEEGFDYEGIPGYQQAIDRSGLQAIPGMDDYNLARQEAQQAAFSSAWDLMGPQFDIQQEGLETRLANQGIPVGSEAYTRVMDNFNRRKSQALQQAAYGAIPEGRAAQAADFQRAVARREMGAGDVREDIARSDWLRQQQIAEQERDRARSMNELAALLQGAPAVTLPADRAPAPVQVHRPDVMGAYSLATNAAMDAYKQQAASRAAGLGSLATMAGTALGGPMGGWIGSSMFGGGGNVTPPTPPVWV